MDFELPGNIHKAIQEHPHEHNGDFEFLDNSPNKPAYEGSVIISKPKRGGNKRLSSQQQVKRGAAEHQGVAFINKPTSKVVPLTKESSSSPTAHLAAQQRKARQLEIHAAN
jgi:hypothetical protein